jgi:hypothetical protein
MKALPRLYFRRPFLKGLTDKGFRRSIKVKAFALFLLTLPKPLSIADFSGLINFHSNENYFAGMKNRLNLFHSNFLNNQL